MTIEQIRRVLSAIVETDRLIEQERRYSTHLRHHDKLAFYEAHKAKLQDMLREPFKALLSATPTH